jgi:hypothetical protein
MTEILTGLPPHTVGFTLSGKLHDEDYRFHAERQAA